MATITGADIRLSAGEFEDFSRFIYDVFGINLGDNKRDMLTQRLRSLVVEQGFTSFADFFAKQLKNPSREVLSDVIDRVSTNHTYFNREPAHFQVLVSKVLPEITSKIRQSKTGLDFRMWCAAASRGHEPYTLAMLVKDYLGSEYSQWKAGLLATDISDNALSVAREGVYPQTEVDALPAALQQRYFSPKGEGFAQVAPAIKKEVTYRRLNLMNASYPFRQPFHVVFCRNVLIYFDSPTKRAVCERIADVMVPNGYLFVGLAESLGRDAPSFDHVQPGVYRKK